MQKFKKIAIVLALVVLAGAGYFMTTSNGEAKATPQSDFYSYVNAKWLEETKLTEDKSFVGNFVELQEETTDNVKAMLEALNKDYANLKEGSDEKKLIDFYNMALDFKTRDDQGFEPIAKQLEAIRKVDSLEEFNQLSVKLAKDDDLSKIIQIGVAPDRKDSSNSILYIEAPGLSFSKVYLEGKDDYSKKEIVARKQFMTEAFKLSGDSEERAKEKVELIYNLEKKQAEATLSKEEESNHEAQYNVMTWEEIKALAPKLPYYEVAQILGLDNANKIVITQPKAVTKTNELFTEENLEAFKAQLEYELISTNSSYLSKDLINAVARYLEAITGGKADKTDEDLAFEVTEENFSDLLGKVYVEKYFPESSKDELKKMVEEIKAAYKTHLEAVEWMSEETKAKAIKKLDTLVVKIGYPDKWEDYSKVTIKTFDEGGNLVENIQNMKRSKIDKHLESLNQAPDRSVWAQTPHTVNAYYNPVFNEIVFPAAILQAPFYDPQASFEENLGGIGVVIAHEVSHAFDNSGAQFDEKGNLANWWKEEEYKNFQETVKKAADMYSKLEVLPGYFVNGEISTGEIAADLGGLTIAIDIAKEKGLDTKKVFESYAQVWREKKTDEQMIADITDEHPPGKYRVNYIVNQLEQFYTDFDVKEGDPMYLKPEERLKIW